MGEAKTRGGGIILGFAPSSRFRHVHLPGGVSIGFGIAAHLAVGVHAGQVAQHGVGGEEDADHRVVGASVEVV